MSTVKLTAELIEAFSGTFLSPLYDNPKPTPNFHREVWELYCSDYIQCAVAAPRNHAKSTAFTHDFILANVLFQIEPYVILLSSTEDMAKDHLNDISVELHNNEDIREHFGVRDFLVDQKTELIVRCDNGYQFRIVARGAEQHIRGSKWLGRRPGLIVFDDIEDDEQVENKDRRQKFANWFFRACKQALRDGGKIRGHGTILHDDSLLAKLMKHRSWHTKLYKAHKAFDDFSNILWVEKFSEKRLRAIQMEFLDRDPSDPEGYSQEYLNDPFDSSLAYLRRDDFLPMNEDDYKTEKIVCAAWDFAIGTREFSDRTSCTVGGKDVSNLLHVVDERLGRWNIFEIIEEMFSVQKAWSPEMQWVEDDTVWKTLSPVLYREMQKRDKWINIVPIRAVKDKATRGRSYQRRHRAHGMRFDKNATWYPAYEHENLRFTGGSQATHDDQFDSTALLSRGFDDMHEVVEEDFRTPEEEEFEREDPRQFLDRGSVTGY